MDNSPRRSDDVAMAELIVKFQDFTERYERDREDDKKRQNAEWQHTQEWRAAHWTKIDENSKLLNEIAPNYRRGILVISTIFVGTIAYVLKALLGHFKWQ